MVTMLRQNKVQQIIARTYPRSMNLGFFGDKTTTVVNTGANLNLNQPLHYLFHLLEEAGSKVGGLELCAHNSCTD